MRYDTSRTFIQPPRGNLSELLRLFPSSVAVAHEDMNLDATPAWQPVCYGQSFESQVMRSIRAQYARDERWQLWVTTARSTDGLDPRGLPNEDSTTQIVNFLVNTDDRYRSGREADYPQADERGISMIRRMQEIGSEVNSAQKKSVVVPWDNREIIGRRTDVRGCGIVEVPADRGSTVLCVGTIETIAHLSLRTAVLNESLSSFLCKLI